MENTIAKTVKSVWKRAARKRHCQSSNVSQLSKKRRICEINTDDTVTLTIFFVDLKHIPPRGLRKIRCKLSDYPNDILERVHKLFLSAIPIEEFELNWLPHYNHSINNKDHILLNLTEKTIGEIGISDRDYFSVFRRKTDEIDWIPLPLTGDDALGWFKDCSKRTFLNLVKRLEICGPDEALSIFELIESESKHGHFERETFKSMFCEKDRLVDSFNWVLGNIDVRLSPRYVRFYIDVESIVWYNPLISPFKKHKLTNSKVFEAIKNALMSSTILNEIIVGLILSFHGHRAIPLPYHVYAMERFFLRKEAREKSMGRCIKLMLEDVLLKAKNDIYSLLSQKISKVETISLGLFDISVNYNIPRPYIRDALNRYFFSVLKLKKLNLYDRELKEASKWVLDALVQHFRDKGFKVYSINTRLRTHRKPYKDDSDFCGGFNMSCSIKPSVGLFHKIGQQSETCS